MDTSLIYLSSSSQAHISHIQRCCTEIICMIGEHCDDVTQACLAFTCHDLLSKLGWRGLPTSWERLGGFMTKAKSGQAFPKDMQEKRYELLKRLEKDLVFNKACPYCDIIHPEKLSIRQKYQELSSLEKFLEKFGSVNYSNWGLVWKLSYRNIYEVMASLKLMGRPRRQLCRLEHSGDWTLSWPSEAKFLTTKATRNFRAFMNLDIQPHVEDNVLLLHQAQRMWIPVHQLGTGIVLKDGITADDVSGLHICCHHDSAERRQELTKAIEVAVRSLLDPSKSSVPGYELQPFEMDGFENGLSQCSLCPTEFTINIRLCPSECDRPEGIELILDVWQALGKDLGKWATCWDSTRIHMFAPRFMETPYYPSTITNNWDEEDVERHDKVLFTIRRGESGLSHPSTDSMVACWKRLEDKFTQDRQRPVVQRPICYRCAFSGRYQVCCCAG